MRPLVAVVIALKMGGGRGWSDVFFVWRKGWVANIPPL